MARSKKPEGLSHKFRDKLILNQWLINQFGVSTWEDNKINGKSVLPFHKLANTIRDTGLEGLDNDNLHRFYHAFTKSELFFNEFSKVSLGQMLAYEENIASHTAKINERRERPIVWKYFQWLTLLFVEVYLDKYFNDRDGLLVSLNDFIDSFNRHWGLQGYKEITPYTDDDLNKLCFQSATGSGKTLLMHVNLLQFQHYAKQSGKVNDVTRVILITPNVGMSEQHIDEFTNSGFFVSERIKPGGQAVIGHIDVLEITKLADTDGPNTIATRTLGDQNLLLVDEGHRGMSGKEEGAWLSRRAALCAKGFTFEYSATFEQAIAAAKSPVFEDSYAKSVLFDYSYRWFYEDGFGKDYQILNLPKTFDQIQALYLTACLLKFYQQLRIYEENKARIIDYNIEKPLWIFVGSTVSKAKGGTKDEEIVAADVALIIEFIAEFLAKQQLYIQNIEKILSGSGKTTGLLDKNNNDIFAYAFDFLAKQMRLGEKSEDIYHDILKRLFNSSGGHLSLNRTKGDSGEISLIAGNSNTAFGLINVGDAKGLCEHIEEYANQKGLDIAVTDSEFADSTFASVKESSSPVNVLIGAKKFIEGWDCWRVSTMGLMHVGKSEGSQIIQLFGRGVRLKGYQWSLKRSNHIATINRPGILSELETLNVFGIEADFMERFREYLKAEGLPGNEKRKTIVIPLNVTYDVGKKLMVLRPKKKEIADREYDFKKDAPVPSLGEIPQYIYNNPVVSDWYPKIQIVKSNDTVIVSSPDVSHFNAQHIELLNLNTLFFELEKYKRERFMYNLNISKTGIVRLLSDKDWYILYLPHNRMTPDSFMGVMLLQKVATELLKRYIDKYYNYCKREFIEPRLELVELTRDDKNLPREDENYQFVVDASDTSLIADIERLAVEIKNQKNKLLQISDIKACSFDRHLYQPLFQITRGGRVSISPIVLNESEFQFVTDLKTWYEKNSEFTKSGAEMFLLRNKARAGGIGFFEAGGFYPDFILWILKEGKQYITFIDPHGLLHEGPGSEKVNFYHKIKEVEKRLNCTTTILNSFILSWTKYPQIKWGESKAELAKKHVLFMGDEEYIAQMMTFLV